MKDKIFLAVGVLAGVITLISSAGYMFWGKVVPGLAPFTLAIVMFVCARMFYVKRKKENDHEKYSMIVTCVFLIACILNIVAGFMQVLARVR